MSNMDPGQAQQAKEAGSSSDKTSFDAMKMVHIAHSFSHQQDKATIDSVLRDWRGYIAARFALTPDQQSFLDAVDDGRHQELAGLLRDVVDSGGSERLVVVMVADHERDGGMYHELRKESVEESNQGLRPNFVIAHCDAHCRNWGWGPA
jgi:hypothetical protein